MTARRLLVRAGGQTVQLPATDTLAATKMGGALDEATPVDLGANGSFKLPVSTADSNTVRVVAGSASNLINGFDTLPAGARRMLRFSVAYTLIATSNFILLTSDNIEAQVEDVAEFLSLGGGNWRMVGYSRKNGQGLASLPLDGSKQMTGGINEAPRVRVGSPASGVIDLTTIPANVIDLYYTDAAPVISFGNGVSGMRRTIMRSGRNSSGAPGQDSAAITLKHSESGLDLITKKDIVFQVGDSTEFECVLPGVWRMLRYDRGDGTALVAPATPSSTDGLTEGTSNLYFTQARVRATPLTGLDASTAAALLNTDSVLAAFGKLQAQINALGKAFRVETIPATSVGQTSFTVPNGYTAGSIVVWLNGVLLQAADYTATNGTTVVLAVGAASTQDIMQVGVLSALRTQDDALLQYTVAGLPAASTSAYRLRWCTNMSGGAGVVVSNGTNWVRVADNTIVTV